MSSAEGSGHCALTCPCTGNQAAALGMAGPTAAAAATTEQHKLSSPNTPPNLPRPCPHCIRLGHPTKHINVGQYRRCVKGAEHQASGLQICRRELAGSCGGGLAMLAGRMALQLKQCWALRPAARPCDCHPYCPPSALRVSLSRLPTQQDAEFFDIRNPVGQKLRHAALEMALADMEAWLETGAGLPGVARVGCGFWWYGCLMVAAGRCCQSWLFLLQLSDPSNLESAEPPGHALFRPAPLPPWANGTQVAVLGAPPHCPPASMPACLLPCFADGSQVAVLDATNSTEERRNYLRTRFHGKWQYLFIESICNDMEVRVLENTTCVGVWGGCDGGQHLCIESIYVDMEMCMWVAGIVPGEEAGGQ